MNRFPAVLICTALIASATARTVAQTTTPRSSWREGQPRACLKNGDALLGWFKDRAKNLGPDGKLRVLIIGDSLSDGGTWAQYFRRGLQTAYGDGGPGNIWSTQPGSAPGQGAAPEWLFSAADFSRPSVGSPAAPASPFGMYRMFGTMADEAFPVNVFRSWEVAQQWLGWSE